MLYKSSRGAEGLMTSAYAIKMGLAEEVFVGEFVDDRGEACGSEHEPASHRHSHHHQAQERAKGDERYFDAFFHCRIRWMVEP